MDWQAWAIYMLVSAGGRNSKNGKKYLGEGYDYLTAKKKIYAQRHYRRCRASLRAWT